MKLIYSNVAMDVPKPKVPPREMTCWDLNEARKFLESLKGRLAALYVLALDSGLRQGELLALNWRDVDMIEGTVTVRHSLEEIEKVFKLKSPKSTKSRRTVWIGQSTVEALRRHREAMRKEGRDVVTGPAFVSRKGKWVAKEALRGDFFTCIKKAGVSRIRFHDLRHTSATLLLQAGASIKAVSERLGHESIEITLKNYVHVLPSESRDLGRLAGKLFQLSHEHPTIAAECPDVQVNGFATSQTG
jgi:integrase